MKRYFIFALILLFAHNAKSHSEGINYLVSELKSDPRYMISVTRLFACKIQGRPRSTIRVPWEIYPEESRRAEEEGTVFLQLIFDSDWCVHKATVLKSSGYYRLDNVSLEFVMTVKYSFEVKDLIDGRPALTIPIAWRMSPGLPLKPSGIRHH